MSDKLSELLQNNTKVEILKYIENALEKSDEAPFWKEKIVPFIDAILSVLLPLKKQNLLFTPEGKIKQNLDSTLFYEWTDLISLRTLAFTLELSNAQNKLLRTSYKDVEYKKIDLEVLGRYLSSYKVNLVDEDHLDFPVGNYNLHIGMVTIIKSLF
ncbi:MAG: hypothetical protein CL623_07445 [Arcobacter sp.]|nr:hypothetical protein [Arcobacter sp.]|tara:strand:+ start:2982 stop:3449 length:468 start_codon:yes stop_codon:yes gene_type:complete